MAAAPAASEPPAFDVDDPRIHFSKETGRWEFEDDDGDTMEWDTAKSVWVPQVDEDAVRTQQAAYAVSGVDEEAPAAPIVARANKKRKKDEDYTSATSTGPITIKRSKNDKPVPTAPAAPKPSKNTAVYVTGLPPDATAAELAARFGKCGVLMEDDAGLPRVKLYARDDGAFAGEALVVFFKEESTALAVAMLDDAELRVGEAAGGRMGVSLADFKHKAAEGRAEVAQAPTAPGERNGRAVDKKKASKRIGKMQRKLEEWGSDDDFGPSPEVPETSTAPAANPNARVVVLRHMFTLAQLAEDASLLLDLKEDVREECSSLGVVTNVVLYDKEPLGVMTVKFRDPVSALACILKMNGRFFDGRRVEAEIYDGKQRFARTGDRRDVDEEDSADAEKKRLDSFADWLMRDGD